MADDQTTQQSEHIKNPGRVAWGKKLARMSKELKAEKKAKLGPSRLGLRGTKPSDEKIEELIQKDIKIDTETKSTLNLHRIEVIVGIAAGIGGLVFVIHTLYSNYKSSCSTVSSVLGGPSQGSILEGPSRPNPGGIGPPQTVVLDSICYDPRNF